MPSDFERPGHWSRRSALVAAAGMLTTTLTFGYFRWDQPERSIPAPAVEASDSGNLPPWSAFGPRLAATYEAIENWIAREEAAGREGLVAQQIQTLLDSPVTPGDPSDVFKSRVLDVLAWSNRGTYVPFTVGGLHAAGCTEALEWRLLGMASKYIRDRAGVIPPEMKRQLRLFVVDSTRCSERQRTFVKDLLK